MEYKTANKFMLDLAKCMLDHGVTRHAVRQSFRQANLTMKLDPNISDADKREVEVFKTALATAYFELER